MRAKAELSRHDMHIQTKCVSRASRIGPQANKGLSRHE
jgi:hypothetical protein